MTEVIGVRFRNRGKTYYFDPAGIQVQEGEGVIVETSKGVELGDCVIANHSVADDKIIPPLRPLHRIASDEDKSEAEKNRAREKDAFIICEEKIRDHGLAMKLVDVEYNFEGSKILFFFTSEGRVDFRELVKDLASVFRTRIELRQIGVRDEAKMLGGIGVCGRGFCCSQFLNEFQPVSTKMAKTQSMSLNPAKISGSCGRLMCCLRYEQEAYEDLVSSVPKNGAFVETPAGYGSVIQVSLLRRKVKVRIDGETPESAARVYGADDVAVIPGGRPKPGEPLPSVLPEAVRERVLREERERKEPLLPRAVFFEEPEPKPQAPAAEKPRETRERKPHKGEGRRRRTEKQEKPQKHVTPTPAPAPQERENAVKQPRRFRKPHAAKSAPKPEQPQKPHHKPRGKRQDNK